VLHARPRGLDSTREPLQIGARSTDTRESKAISSTQLLADSLAACGVSGAHLDIGTSRSSGRFAGAEE